MSHDEKWSLFLFGLVVMWTKLYTDTMSIYPERVTFRSKGSSCVDISDVIASEILSKSVECQMFIQKYFFITHFEANFRKLLSINCTVVSERQIFVSLYSVSTVNDVHPTVYPSTPSLLQSPSVRTLNVILTIYSHAFISIGKVNTSAFAAVCRSVWVFNQVYSIWKWFTVGKHSSHSVQRLHLIWHKINSV